MARLKYRHRQRLRQILRGCFLCCLMVSWYIFSFLFSSPPQQQNVLPVYWMAVDNEFNGNMEFQLDTLQVDSRPVETSRHETLLWHVFASSEDIALVLENDAEVSDVLFVEWEKILATAPSDWSMLQLWTDNPVVQRHCEALHDPWITWFPEHTGTAAYFVRRDRIENILANNGTLFERATTYTSTRFYAKSMRLYELSTLVPKWPVVQESVLVITTVAISNRVQFWKEVARWRSDFNAIHADWHVTLVVREADLLTWSMDNWPTFSNLKLSAVHDKEQYSKFRFVRESIPSMASYKHVILKDSDQHLVGLPWQSFLERSYGAVIAGPLRQVVHGDGHRQWFTFQNGHKWKEAYAEKFKVVETRSTPVLEQFFVVMDGSFAAWFFPQILTDPMLVDIDGEPVRSNWGPDMLWCGAAAEWSTTRTSCVVVPVISKHDDTRQVVHWSTSGRRKYLNLQQEKRYEQSFPQWLFHNSSDVTQ